MQVYLYLDENLMNVGGGNTLNMKSSDTDDKSTPFDSLDSADNVHKPSDKENINSTELYSEDDGGIKINVCII